MKPILKTPSVVALFCLAASFPLEAQTPSPVQKAGLTPIEGRPILDAETQQLNSLLSTATASANSILPGPDAGAQRRAVDFELCNQLESFVTNYPASAWTPSVHLFLARRARLRCGYSLAMDHYEAAYTAVESGITGSVSESIAREASGGLAKLLALTGQLAAYDALEGAATQLLQRRPSGYEWGWAHEMRAWVAKHPTESYKCGLYCLDQLGRLTQPGAFLPKNITETPSSTNGFNAADLVTLGTSQGLSVRAGLVTDLSKLPVPCILHLRSEHFVIIPEQRGSLYEVIDPVAYGPKWLTPAELAQEATGCAIVSDVSQPPSSIAFSPIDSSAAAAYRGRCHGPLPTDHNDTGCGDPCGCAGPGGDGTGAIPISPGFSAGGSSGGSGGSADGLPGDPAAPVTQGNSGSCGSCAEESGGMPVWRVSEPYLNVWLHDTPLEYAAAYGPAVNLHLAYNQRNVSSIVSTHYWH